MTNQHSANNEIPKHLGDLQLVDDLAEVAWLPAVSHDGPTTRSFVPRGYQRCIRVLDAIYSDTLGRDLKWEDIRPDTTNLGLIDGIEAVLSRFGDSGIAGELVPTRLRRTTLEMLQLILDSGAPGAGGTECWFALWSDDVMFPLPSSPMAYRLSSVRYCYIYHGYVASWRSIWPTLIPSLWWPIDRSWCIAHDVDLRWTYIAGSEELADSLLTSGLPCEEAPWDERITK
jgi:hypothetical protein